MQQHVTGWRSTGGLTLRYKRDRPERMPYFFKSASAEVSTADGTAALTGMPIWRIQENPKMDKRVCTEVWPEDDRDRKR